MMKIVVKRATALLEARISAGSILESYRCVAESVNGSHREDCCKEVSEYSQAE